MGKKAALFVVLLLCAAVMPAAVAQKKMNPELFVVLLDMPEAEARARMDKIGQWEEEKEQRRDSVWKLMGDRHFSEVAVGFDKETRRVRYVTAFVRPDGLRVRPEHVFDLKRTQRYIDPAKNYHYTQRVQARKNQPAYEIIAVGKDLQSLTRLSFKRIDK